MRIALVTENTYCGGLDSFIVTLVEAWPHPEDELVLVCNHDHPGLEVIGRRVTRKLAILGHRLPLASRWLARLPAGPVAKALSPLARYGAFAAQLLGMRRLLGKLRPDRVMVINGGYPAGDSCRAASIAWDQIRGTRPKAVHNVHNLAYPARWWEAPLERLIDARVGQASAAFIAVSEACAASLPANRPDAVAAGTPVGHVHNGILPPPEPAAALRAELGIAADAPLALMLGTYEARKGHELLLRAFAKVVAGLPEARLVICGFGYPHDVARVEALVAAHGLEGRVHLLGFRDDVPALLRAADVLVVASQSFESFGLTLVEAMAQRVPVLATRVGGVPEVVGGEDEPDCAGFLVAHDDCDAYADKLERLLADEGLRRRFGEQGHARYSRRFTAARMAGEYAALVRGAV